ncbi:fatty acid desaturase [Acuticoccus sp. I52.16.1]|uniref:fatty acid desaturase n=1 Tax=Acuticoccus sp. I52.16.1 TaxID=2928472 RepID=UPI001FCF8AB6|nr:fatty acid desaturase [Acuticoccus sp. I52.16.1]UOM33516.1 fatty acid desaturase [Acuticoccus sp. I52.16.1]
MTTAQSVPGASAPTPPPSTIDARSIRRELARYTDPDVRRSLTEIALSALPFVALWAAMWLALTSVGYGLTLLLALPAAGFLVRLFLIQHDCGHGSVFRRQSLNDWLGRVLGVFTLTPYDHWRRTHALHHAGAGNLDRRGIGDVATLTVREYRNLSLRGRIQYRIYRHPLILFGLGPFFVFLLHHRLPIGFMRGGLMHWLSTMGTNLAILAAVAGVTWAIGIGPFLMIHLPIVLLASAAGVWLFYVQHQFEHTHWDGDADWTHPEAALHGSSHYALPAVLRWFAANVGIHHVHHLSSRIPHYRLPEVLRDLPELRHTNRLTLRESLACVRLTLWDEELRRLVPFRAAHADGARA